MAAEGATSDATTPSRQHDDIDGVDMVLLSPADFERLDAARRQVRATTARLHELSHRLRRAEQLLDHIATTLAGSYDPAMLIGMTDVQRKSRRPVRS